MTYNKVILKILIGVFVLCFVASAQTKYRKALLLNQSVGGQIYNNINVNCGASSVTAKTSVVSYNRAHSLSGADSVSLDNRYYPSMGNNSFNNWHHIFDKEYTTDWNNLNNYRNTYSVIMIKACFAYEGGHSSEGSPDDIPYRDSRRTTWLTKWHLRAIVDSMKKMPTTFWVIWTQIPVAQNDNTTNAQRDKRIATWMKDTLAAGLDPVYGNNFPANVYIFDAHYLMSDANGKALYGCSSMDPHPTPSGIAAVAPHLINESFDAAIAYEGGMEIPAVPQLKSPGNGSTGQSNFLMLQWYRSQDATYYHVQVAVDSLFTNLVVNDSMLTDTMKNIGPLANLTTHYWRVKAKNPAGSSNWSAKWHFTTADELQVPATPVLYLPGNGSADQPNYILFRWHRSQYATNYQIQISPDSSFGSVLINDSTLIDTFKNVGPLTNNTIYYWRVRAKNIAGRSDWSGKWNLTTSSQTYLFWYHSGWNVVSVPLLVDDYSIVEIFPTASSEAFEYQGNYMPRDTLRNGTGYWLKFDEEQFVPLVGMPFLSETLSVQTGWNLIGTISDSIDVADVITDPDGIVSSPFYSFDGSYQAVSEFTPGQGYWVKISEPGDMIIRRNP